MRLSTRDIELIRELRYMDGLTGRQVAARVGCSTNTVWVYAPGRPGKVPNDKLRMAFLASPVSAVEVARELGWWDARAPDGGRVRRTLGLSPDVSGNGYRSTRVWIDAETATCIAEAIGVAPWEVMPDDEQVAA